MRKKCLDMARELSSRGAKRGILIDMAQTWFHLAEEQEASVELQGSMPPAPTEQPQPVVQQQQQVQPKRPAKKE
jgi:hypothetical protein